MALAEAGYTEVAVLGDSGGGYDWSELRVFTNDEGRVFINGQSGCSCNSWEEPAESDLIEVASLEAAQREWTAAIPGREATNALEMWLDEPRRTFADLGLR